MIRRELIGQIVLRSLQISDRPTNLCCPRPSDRPGKCKENARTNSMTAFWLFQHFLPLESTTDALQEHRMNISHLVDLKNRTKRHCASRIATPNSRGENFILYAVSLYIQSYIEDSFVSTFVARSLRWAINFSRDLLSPSCRTSTPIAKATRNGGGTF